MATEVKLTVRGVATALGIAFCVYYVTRGLWWVELPAAPPLLLSALAIYLGVMLTVILADDDEEGRLPSIVAVFALVGSAAVPTLVSLGLSFEARQAPFATWYIGAIGILGLACIVRGRPLFGWLTLAVLTASAMGWMGAGNALRLGLVGSIVWLVIAQVLMIMWSRAVRDTERLADIQQRVSVWHATGQVRQRERRKRVQFALSIAGPVLGATISRGGALDDDERMQAYLAEGALRDELRGGSLLSDAVRARILDIRQAGGTVTLIDEGGLEGLSPQRCAQLHEELAAALEEVGPLRVIIRAARHEDTAVTVVGRSGEHTDDDAVALWRVLSRDGRQSASALGAQ